MDHPLIRTPFLDRTAAREPGGGRRCAAGFTATLAAAALLGLAALSGLAACTGSPPAPAATGDAPALAAQASLDELYRDINGGVQQRIATEANAYHHSVATFTQCMTAHGATYYAPPFTTRYEGDSDADITYAPATPGAVNWLAHVSGTSLGVGTGLLVDAQVRADANQTPAGVAAMSAADRASYLAILTQCQLTMPDLSVSGQDKLRIALDAVVAGVLAQPEVARLTGGYVTCMARAGYPGATDPAALLRQVGAGYPNPVPEGGASAPTWVAATALEKKAALADEGCRLPAYRAALTALGPNLAQFRTAHATDLATVKSEWDQVVQDAAVPQ